MRAINRLVPIVADRRVVVERSFIETGIVRSARKIEPCFTIGLLKALVKIVVRPINNDANQIAS